MSATEYWIEGDHILCVREYDSSPIWKQGCAVSKIIYSPITGKVWGQRFVEGAERNHWRADARLARHELLDMSLNPLEATKFAFILPVEENDNFALVPDAVLAFEFLRLSEYIS